jgi:transglutaminase-like putative cysteine protease
MRLRIERRERIAFDAPVREHHLEWRSAPWDDAGQRLLRCDVACAPAATLASHRDCFGNQVHRTALLAAHDGLVLSMQAEVETLLTDPYAVEPVPLERERAWLADALHQAPRLWDLVLHPDDAAPLLSALLAGEAPAEVGVPADLADGLPVLRPNVGLFAQLQDATSWITAGCTVAAAPEAAGDAAAVGDAAVAEPSAARVLQSAQGTAAELALLLMSVARGWRLPARLAAGYVFTDDSHASVGAESGVCGLPGGLHHWAEVLVPGAGWRGFDPSRGQVADAAYARLAVGRNCADLRPLRQSWKGDGRLAACTMALRIERVA